MDSTNFSRKILRRCLMLANSLLLLLLDEAMLSGGGVPLPWLGLAWLVCAGSLALFGVCCLVWTGPRGCVECKRRRFAETEAAALCGARL